MTDIDVKHYQLLRGAHTSPEDGMCAMELVAYVAGEPHSDHPACTCPVLTAFVIAWNDGLPDEDRTRLLKPILKDLIGTRSTKAVEHKRSLLALDWYIRVMTPTWLDLVEELKDSAKRLRALDPIDSEGRAEIAKPVVVHAQKEGAAAGDAAWDAAWDAAGAAAGAAARDAAGAAAWDAARAAARAAARDAAGAAARAAAWAAAWDAARQRLSPAVIQLQKSAVNLLRRMIAVTS